MTLGPCILVDEFDPQDIDVELRINGQVRQHYNTREMTFSFAEFLEFLSRDFTFLPGDLLAGGTGEGTAMDASRPATDGSAPKDLFLKVGRPGRSLVAKHWHAAQHNRREDLNTYK